MWDLWKKKDDMIGLYWWVDEKDSKIFIYVDLEKDGRWRDVRTEEG